MTAVFRNAFRIRISLKAFGVVCTPSDFVGDEGDRWDSLHYTFVI
jgi:hypothetical protein